MFEHPDFVENRRLSRREAWQWLIERAAWKPRGDRMSRGIAELTRGQAAVTIRGLAAAWGWPRSNVEYFLRWLIERERIVVDVSQTKIQTRSGTRKSYRASVVTICNYEKFQSRARIGASGVGQSFGQSFGQDQPQLPLPMGQIAAQQDKTRESDKEEATSRLPAKQAVSTTAWKPKPPHGVKNRTGAVQWFDYGTIEWKAAAELQEEETGAKVFPKAYRDGRGNWFKARTPQDWKAWGQAVTARAIR